MSQPGNEKKSINRPNETKSVGSKDLIKGQSHLSDKGSTVSSAVNPSVSVRSSSEISPRVSAGNTSTAGSGVSSAKSKAKDIHESVEKSKPEKPEPIQRVTVRIRSIDSLRESSLPPEPHSLKSEKSHAVSVDQSESLGSNQSLSETKRTETEPTLPLVVVNPTQMQVQVPVVYGPYPVWTRCPNCNVYCLTETKRSLGTMVWASCGTIACITCFCCICCLGSLPFCIEEYYDIEHECRNCHIFLATYERKC